nr:TetR/AcrR family transcriptional regulator [Mycolicibacterium stellerae]
MSTRASSAIKKPPAKRRNTRPEKTIRKLLDATIEELRQSSYLDLTVRGVASRAGVSPASAYKYFPSKSALVADAYLRQLQDVPMFTDVNQSARERVSATLREMAFVVADHPEMAAACANALISDDPGVEPARMKIAAEVGQRISAALGPGWPREVVTIIQMTFNGALITAKGGYLSYPQIAEHLDEAVRLILRAPNINP